MNRLTTISWIVAACVMAPSGARATVVSAPGAQCAPDRASTYLNFSKLFNGGAVDVVVECPVAGDTDFEYGTTTASVWVIDRHYWRDIECQYWLYGSAPPYGSSPGIVWGAWGAGRSRTEGSSSTPERLTLTTWAIDSYDVRRVVQCTIPQTYAGNASAIISYTYETAQ